MEIGFGLWILLALAVGILASREFGRSGVGWFFLALVLTPLAGLLLFMLPARRQPCPFCAEPIQVTATICRYCGRAVPISAERTGLPLRTRIVLLLLILAVLVAALSQCQDRIEWWRGGRSIQVERTVPY
jgi:hypothetical protein